MKEGLREITTKDFNSLLVAPDLYQGTHCPQPVADVVKGFSLLVGAVSLFRKIIYNPLSIYTFLFRAKRSNSDTANHRMQIIPLDVAVILEQTASFKIANSFK